MELNTFFFFFFGFGGGGYKEGARVLTILLCVCAPCLSETSPFTNKSIVSK